MKEIDFLEAVKKYIEETEETIAGEWSSGESFEELLNRGSVPDIYYEIVLRLKGFDNE